MIPVCTAAQTRALDAELINQVGIHGRTLMEVAGRGVAEIIHERFPSGDIAILCGTGNNGGDGYVAARWLTHWGRTVRLSGTACTTEDAQFNRHLCEQLNLPFLSAKEALLDADITVDALLGTGTTRPPDNELAKTIAQINGQPCVVAIDIPTGIHTDTGAVLGMAVKADVTVTLGRWKTGLLAAPGCDHAGDVYCVDIGFEQVGTINPQLLKPAAFLLESVDIARWRPQVGPSHAKWDRGHVGIIGDGGAATLAAHGAFRGGAGLVTLFAPKAMWESFHGLWPEVILAEIESLDPHRHDVLVLGPGLGTHRIDLVCDLWTNHPGAVVADADALTILAQNTLTTPTGQARVITPHTAEAGRLLGLTRAEVEADRFGAARALSNIALPILKGPHTLIGGQTLWINPTGTNKLATAGTGDVLAGMVGGLLAAGVQSKKAAAISVWDHGLASDRMPNGGTASDLINALQGREP